MYYTFGGQFPNFTGYDVNEFYVLQNEILIARKFTIAGQSRITYCSCQKIITFQRILTNFMFGENWRNLTYGTTMISCA